MTRHILEQFRANTEILLERKKEMLGMKQEIGKLSDRVAVNSAQLEAIGPRLSALVADALREAWKTRERN